MGASFPQIQALHPGNWPTRELGDRDERKMTSGLMHGVRNASLTTNARYGIEGNFQTSPVQTLRAFFFFFFL